MYEIPDGSGFFVAEVPISRAHGLLMFLKAEPNGTCRPWLFLWRMFRDARVISRLPDQGPPMGYWSCLRYAWSVKPRGWFRCR
jgi:hypothetical protein